MTEKMSAKIYQFPAGGRSNVASRRSAILPVADDTPAKRAAVSFGSAWYHEEAIRQDELERTGVYRRPTQR